MRAGSSKPAETCRESGPIGREMIEADVAVPAAAESDAQETSGAAMMAFPVKQLHLGTHLASPLSEHGGQVGLALKTLKGEDMVHTETAELSGELVQFLVVADGHGGKEAALHAKKNLVLHFKEAFVAMGAVDASSTSILVPMQRTFARLHEEVCRWPNITAGSTITAVLVNESRGEIVSFNVGDSSAVVIDYTGNTAMLTVDHRRARLNARVRREGVRARAGAATRCGVRLPAQRCAPVPRPHP